MKLLLALSSALACAAALAQDYAPPPRLEASADWSEYRVEKLRDGGVRLSACGFVVDAQSERHTGCAAPREVAGAARAELLDAGRFAAQLVRREFRVGDGGVP